MAAACDHHLLLSVQLSHSSVISACRSAASPELALLRSRFSEPAATDLSARAALRRSVEDLLPAKALPATVSVLGTLREARSLASWSVARLADIDGGPEQAIGLLWSDDSNVRLAAAGVVGTRLTRSGRMLCSPTT